MLRKSVKIKLNSHFNLTKYKQMKTKLNGILTLLLALVVQFAFAQNKTVSGVVSDQDGLPLPGATVLVKGSNTGATTDFDGNYSITAKQGDVLVFSFVGYNNLEIRIGASDQVNATLSQDAQALEEVVVSALGITRSKKAIGYSQQTVQGDVLVQAKDVDLNTALSGKVSGVQMVGAPSSTFDAGLLRLRGETGVLYVVDGIKVYSQSDINTDNIGNISVLKGAAATALFGVDARNGVVVITSKSAKNGQAALTVDHTTTMTSVSLLPDYQNEYGGGYYQEWDTFTYNPATDPADWAAFDGQKIPYYAADESWGPRLDGTLVRHWDSWIPGSPSFGELRPWSANPDNIRDFYNKAINNNTSVSWAKGGEDYKVSATLRNLDQELIMPGASRKQIDMNVNASFDFSEKLNVYTSLNYQVRNTKNEPAQGYGGLGSNFNQWWQRQLDIDRLKDMYFFEGNYYSWNIRSPRNSRPLYWDAPHFGPDNNNTYQEKDVLFGNFGANYKFNDKIKANLEVRRRYNGYFSNSRIAFGGLDVPTYRESRSRYEQNEIFGFLSYTDRFLNDALDLDVKVGYQMQQNKETSTSASTVGGLSVPNFYSIATSVDRPSYSNSFVNSKVQSNFASVSIGYNSMFYLDGSYRLDWGSTANVEDNRLDTYGFSGSFIFNSLLNVDVISFAKVRAGLAQAPIFPGAYQTTSVYNVGSPYGSNASFSVPNTQSNPNLLGGTRNETEIGLEMKFLKNRVGLDFTYFDRKDSQLPVAIPVTAETGYTGLSINSGQTSSNGIELAISGTPDQSDNWTWDMSVNFGTLEKRVDNIYPGIEKNVLGGNLSWYSLQLQEIPGEEWGTFVGRKRKTDANGNYILNSDGSYVVETNQKLGNILPDFTGGFSSTLRYKNAYLNLGLDFQKGGLFYSTTNMFSSYSGLHASTAGLNDAGKPLRDPVDDGGGVHVVGVDANGASVDTYVEAQEYFGGLFGIHDAWLYDASYIKLRQLRIGYTLPKQLIANTPFKTVDVSVIGNNLFLLYSKVDGLDPSEIEGQGSLTSPYRAVEGGQLPPARSIGLNVKINF